MSDASRADTGLTPDQIAVFASGLYHVAMVGGVHETEVSLIREFLNDAGAPELEASITRTPFDIERAVVALDTSFLRRLFLKACILMVFADHEVTEDEREVLTFFARAFGLTEDLQSLEDEVRGERLD
jgi:hypothetical protein